MDYKLGKLPARKDSIELKLKDYLTTLPTPPKVFGHEDLIGANWQMLGNDQYGDCVWAGAAHETMMWAAEGGTRATFDNSSVLSDYSAVTGFNPNDPNTDQGTDMQVAASYRKKTGVKDAQGNRHKVAAYLAITPGNLAEHYIAMYLFGAVGIGIKVPNNAIDQFKAGKPWSVTKGSSIEGGHYVPLVAHRGNLLCVTWGKVQQMTASFFKKYNDESVVYISQEILNNGKSLEGFDLAQLQADLAQLK